MKVRLRHLDVVAEDAVVADLERCDAGAFSLGSLHVGNVLLGVSTDRSQLVELEIAAFPYESPVPNQRGWVIHKRRFDHVADLCHLIELSKQTPDERSLTLADHGAGSGYQ